jgi:hypothetical protein
MNTTEGVRSQLCYPIQQLKVENPESTAKITCHQMKYNRIRMNHELGRILESSQDRILKHLSVDTEEYHKIK